MGVGGKVFEAAFAAKMSGIPQTGDADVAKRGYLNVNLGDKETGSGCLLRPTRHSENAAHSHITPWEWAAWFFNGEIAGKYFSRRPNG
jgi:hypothetical protein